MSKKDPKQTSENGSATVGVEYTLYHFAAAVAEARGTTIKDVVSESLRQYVRVLSS